MTCDIARWTQNDVKNGISLKTFLHIELKLCTVVILITKFHDMSTVTFPWQHNGLQALSIQRVKSRVSLQVLFALDVHSVGVSKYGHYTAQAQESLFNSGATNKAFFILGR